MPIKDEPLDDTDDDFQMKCIDESDDMMDPTMFLERSEHEGDVPIMVSIGIGSQSLAAHTHHTTHVSFNR